jgi:hypothetical protein
MNIRVIPLEFPQGSIPMMERCPVMNRPHNTTVRDLFAFIGQGKVWAVSELVEVTPVVWKPAKAGEEPEKPVGSDGWLWRFAPITRVEGIECPEYREGAFFKNGDVWEPQHLNSSVAAKLRAWLELEQRKNEDHSNWRSVTGAPDGDGFDEEFHQTCDSCLRPGHSDCDSWVMQGENGPVYCLECSRLHEELTRSSEPEIEPVAAPVTTRSVTLGVKPVEAKHPKPRSRKAAHEPYASVEIIESCDGQLAMF